MFINEASENFETGYFADTELQSHSNNEEPIDVQGDADASFEEMHYATEEFVAAGASQTLVWLHPGNANAITVSRPTGIPIGSAGLPTPPFWPGRSFVGWGLSPNGGPAFLGTPITGPVFHLFAVWR